MDNLIARASSFDDAIAAERGRLLAARAIAENADQRKRVEDMFGVAYCRNRYPEAYRSGFGKFMDRMRITFGRVHA